jgi:hypothetical protein
VSIEYKYTVMAVDLQARCMDVVYEAEGHQTMHIGARLPLEGETLEDVVKMFSPVALWRDLAAAVILPAVGASGVITPPEPEPDQVVRATSPIGLIPAAVL